MGSMDAPRRITEVDKHSDGSCSCGYWVTVLYTDGTLWGCEQFLDYEGESDPCLQTSTPDMTEAEAREKFGEAEKSW